MSSFTLPGGPDHLALCHDLAGDIVHAGALDPGYLVRRAAAHHGEAFTAQRFQASLSSFTVARSYLAVITPTFWVLFYVR
jgi:hypothetical protein